MKKDSPYKFVHYYNRPHTAKRVGTGGKYSVAWMRSQLKQLKVQKGCCVCGERAPEALHFHHIDPSHKKFTISQSTHEWAEVQQEITKCEVLCANCHAKVHSGRLKRRQPLHEV